MKVILLKDVRGVGQRHEIKEVADGYALNALFPQRAAEPATAQKIQQLEAQKHAHEAQLQKEEEQLMKKMDALRNTEVTIASRATEKGGLFKAVTAKDIARAIREQHSFEIPEEVISLPAAFKTTGEHTAALVHKNLRIELRVKVTAA